MDVESNEEWARQIEADRARKEIIAAAVKFLEDYEAGRRPDAPEEAVEAAREIEYWRWTNSAEPPCEYREGHPGSEGRRLLDALDGGEDSPEALAAEERLWELMRRGDEAIDAAASRLA